MTKQILISVAGKLRDLDPYLIFLPKKYTDMLNQCEEVVGCTPLQ